MDEFFISEKASAGTKLPLRTPDGKPTPHWLLIRSQWSDEFVEAKEDALARLSEELVVITDPKKRKAAGKPYVVQTVAALVAGWSFEQECNHDNVVAFLKKAPQIADQVNKIAGDDRLFFGAGS